MNQENKENTNQQTQNGRPGNLKGLIDGSLLTTRQVLHQLPFILFLTFLAIIYISNRHHAEKLLRNTNKLERELRDLRSEYITTASELMRISKQSEVLKLTQKNGLELKESVEPPTKIVITKKDDF